MNGFISALGPVADAWGTRLWQASLSGGVAIAVAWAIARWCTFLSPRVVCWVWRLACLKLLVALCWVQPVSLALLPAEPRAVAADQAIFEKLPALPDTFPALLALEVADSEQPPVEEPEPAPAPPVMPALVLLLWLAGLCYCVYRTSWQWRCVRLLRQSSQPITSEHLQRMCRDEARRLGLRCLPSLRFSSKIESPLLVGIWRPTILLPAGVEQHFDEAEIRLMLAHELAHLKRHDLIWNWLPTLATWLFFFHPLVWLMRRQWSQALEAACDEVLIQKHLAEPAGYGRLLLKLAARLGGESPEMLTAAGVLGTYQNLERRVLAMVRVKPFSAGRLSVAAGLLSLVGILGLVPWQLVAREPANASDQIAASETETKQAPTESQAFRFAMDFSDEISEPRYTAPDSPAQKALDRLKALGAAPADPITIGIQKPWKGTDADLNLLGELPDFKRLILDLDVVDEKIVAGLEFKNPIQNLILRGANETNLTKLPRLPRCRQLSLHVTLDSPLTPVGYARLAQLSQGIESLHILDSHLTDDDLKEIGQIHSLQGLRIGQGDFTDNGLSHLASLDKLEDLWLMSCPNVHGPGYAHLAKLKSLGHLYLVDMHLDAEGYLFLATLTQIDSLDLQLEKCPDDLPPATLEALAKLTKLQSLTIDARYAGQNRKLQLGDDLLGVAGKLPELRKFHLSGIGTNADALEALAAAPHLEELVLDPFELSDRSLAILGRLSTLQKLGISSSDIVTDTISEQLSKIDSITQLTLYGGGLTDERMLPLAKLKKMEFLCLHNTPITGRGFAAFKDFKQLKRLMLPKCPVDDKGVETLRGLSSLEILNLSYTKITDGALDAIAALPNLKVIYLDGTSVTAEGLLKLRDLKHLHSVIAVGTKVRGEDMARLHEAFPRVSIMQSLSSRDELKAEPAPKEKTGDSKENAAGEAETKKGVLKEIRYRNDFAEDEKTLLDYFAQKAVARFKELGATPINSKMVGIQSGWKGATADLALIRMLPDLNWLFLDLEVVGTDAVGEIELQKPVENLILSGATDEKLDKLSRLPKCRNLTLPLYNISEAGYGRIAHLAQGIEGLGFMQTAENVSRLDDDALKQISQIRSLHSLSIFRAPITDAGLSHLANLDKLESLTLIMCPEVHGPGYAHLKALRNLTLMQMPLDLDGFFILAQLKQLETLSLELTESPVDLPPAGVKELMGMSNLESLSINARALGENWRRAIGNDLGDGLLTAAGQLNKLRILHVEGISVSAEGLEALAPAAGLEELALDSVDLGDRSLVALSQIKTLKKLGITSNRPVTHVILEKLVKLDSITKLELTNSELNDEDLTRLAKLPALQVLVLPNSLITGKQLSALKGLEKLQILTLSNAPLSDEGAQALKDLPALQWLTLHHTKITDRALDAIATLDQLRFLDVSGTSISAEGLLKLRDLKHLQYIEAGGTKVREEDLSLLQAAMPRVRIPLDPPPAGVTGLFFSNDFDEAEDSSKEKKKAAEAKSRK